MWNEYEYFIDIAQVGTHTGISQFVFNYDGNDLSKQAQMMLDKHIKPQVHGIKIFTIYKLCGEGLN